MASGSKDRIGKTGSQQRAFEHVALNWTRSANAIRVSGMYLGRATGRTHVGTRTGAEP